MIKEKPTNRERYHFFKSAGVYAICMVVVCIGLTGCEHTRDDGSSDGNPIMQDSTARDSTLDKVQRAADTSSTTTEMEDPNHPMDTAKIKAQVYSLTLAKGLIKDSEKAYWHVATCGQKSPGMFRKGKAYYKYMSPDIDTETELLSYLSRYFSAASITRIFRELNLITHKGKLAKTKTSNADISNWKKAKFSQLGGNEFSKAIKVEIPIGNGESSVKYRISLIQNRAKQWRVNTPYNDWYQDQW